MARARAPVIDAAVILVAHDRWFLEAVTTATLELDAGRATFFPGPWHAWRQEKAARLLPRRKRRSATQADIERLQRFVERFRAKKDKAKQAQAKLTQIGRLEQEQSRRPTRSRCSRAVRAGSGSSSSTRRGADARCSRSKGSS